MDNSTILRNDYHETTEYEKLSMLFQMQQAYVDRTKITFSILLLRWHPTCQFPNMVQVEQYQLLYDYVSKQIRNSDKVFKDTEGKSVIIMLAFSGNQEAKHFLNRLFKNAKDYLGDICENVMPGFLATISEIANYRYTLDEILLTNTQYLDKISNQPINTILSIHDFSQFETEHIKVSIIEENPITISILSNLLHKMNISNFDLKIKTFTDGYQFLQSDWYKSGHTHIVLVNDILPRKNGIEIMNYLRSLPNDEKYIIMLMSKRTSEDAMIYAFDNGADAYFSRPFNLRLVETQIKNILRRLRQ